MSDLLDALVYDFVERVNAPAAVAVEYLRTASDAALENTLRHHADHPVSGRLTIDRRASFDALLSFYGLLEIGTIEGLFEVAGAAKRTAKRHLQRPAVVAYYEEHYPLVLPRLLRRRLEGHPLAGSPPSPRAEARTRFTELQALIHALDDPDAAPEEWSDVEAFWWLLDDGETAGGESLDDLVEAFSGDGLTARDALLGEGTDDIHSAIRGLYQFLEFATEFEPFLAKQPAFFASVYWHQFGYWFDRLGPSLTAVTGRVLQAVGPQSLRGALLTEQMIQLTSGRYGWLLQEAAARTPQRLVVSSEETTNVSAQASGDTGPSEAAVRDSPDAMSHSLDQVPLTVNDANLLSEFTSSAVVGRPVADSPPSDSDTAAAAGTRPVSKRHTTTWIGQSAPSKRLREDIRYAAMTDAKVLITGESGAGKELVARAIHDGSARSSGPFITINCAGIPETLLESELFGHVRGSFSGAFRDRPGLLESARRGTVFLDEVAEMSLRMQGLLLRFLETGEIQRVGADLSMQRADVRIVAATNRPLNQDIEEKRFRSDLYYRLNVVHLVVPSLRERRGDVPLLLKHFIESYAQRYKTTPSQFTDDALALLTAYDWPGNVRELKNTAERLVVRRLSVVTAADLPHEILNVGDAISAGETAADPNRTRTLDELMARLLNGRESFWSVVYDPYMSRSLTREEIGAVVRAGLKRTSGSYSALLHLFNMETEDYKRFLNFLRKHDLSPLLAIPKEPARRGRDTRITERRQHGSHG